MKICQGVVFVLVLTVLPVMAKFTLKMEDQCIRVQDDGRTVFGWQLKPLENPKGGEVFAASAFIHPLCTPSGFELTKIQPDDHLHHFGVWWPWKMVTVGGKDYVTWEIQKHQGRHRAESCKSHKVVDNEVVLEFHNATEISDDGKSYRKVLDEVVRLRFLRIEEDAYGLDIHITQQPVGDITITKYRYSGFSWRGTSAWHKNNSVMRTSGGHHRDNANHQPAKWVTVDGVTPHGRATMLMMSAAKQPELLRVWGSKQHDGHPFVNFNPVVKEPVALKPENPTVSDRRYRLVVADRVIAPDEADQLWKAWMEE